MTNIAGSAVRRTVFGLSVRMKRGYVCYVEGCELLPAQLSWDEERELLTRMAGGDLYAREVLINHNLRLVVYVARTFANAGIGMDDLISIGMVGLIKAVRSFDMDRNIKLASYASRCVRNEILMGLRRSKRLRAEVSLDGPLREGRDGAEQLLSDILGTDADVVTRGLDAEAERRALYRALGTLGSRERRIVDLRFGLSGGGEYTQKEVAAMMGISQSYISRLERRILERLHGELAGMI